MALGKYTIFLVHIGVYEYYIYWFFRICIKIFNYAIQNKKIQLLNMSQNTISLINLELINGFFTYTVSYK